MPLYRRKGSANWWCKISVAGHETRQSTKTEDREQAEEFEHRERDRLWRLHKLGDKSAVRWSQVAERWMSETGKKSTEKDKIILEWLEPYIADEPISNITREAIEELRKLCLDDGKKKRSKATVDRYMALVRSILRKCEREWDLLDRAPVVPMYRPKRGEPRFLTYDEWGRLKKELPKHLELAAHFAVLTGLRMRAMLALTWDRVDMAGARLWIPGTHQKAGKTHGIPLAPEAIEVLKKLRKLNTDGDHVFQWKGKPVDDCNGKAFQDALERAKIDRANWHTLRHTFASWAVMRGVTLQELMELGDWSSYEMVLRYSHLAPDHLMTAARKLGTKQAQRKKSTERKSLENGG
jgi:integrase